MKIVLILSFLLYGIQVWGLESEICSEITDSTLMDRENNNRFSDEDPASYEYALRGVVMWGAVQQAYGNMSYIKFKSYNEVEMGERLISDEEQVAQWYKLLGTFKIRKIPAGIVVETDIDGQIETYRLMKDSSLQMWYLVLASDPMVNPLQEGFVDYPSQCV